MTPPEPAFSGIPEDGDKDVPTDVVLFYHVPDALLSAGTMDHGTFVLEGPDGREVALDARLVYYHNELTPEGGLLPHSRYTLHGRWTQRNGVTSEDTLSFETGDGPLTQQPPPPVAVMTHFELVADMTSSCGPPKTGSCISVADDDAWLEQTYIDEFDQRQPGGSTRGSFQTNLLGMEQLTNFKCISLRTRALNGTYSTPVELCGADAPLTRLTDLRGLVRITCSSQGLAWSDERGSKGSVRGADVEQTTSRSSSASESCNVQRAGAGSSPLALGWTSLLLALAVFRRRRAHGATARRIRSAGA